MTKSRGITVEEFELLIGSYDPAETQRLLTAIRNEQLLREQHPWVADIVAALWDYPDGRLRRRVIEILEREREDLGMPMPKSFENVVQAAFNRHSSDSSVFAKQRAQNEFPLFSTSGPHGDRKWVLQKQNAQKWLASKIARKQPDGSNP